MADPASRRTNRIESPTIDVVFRDEVSLDTRDVWREDDLYDSAGSMYRVLDFGVEERIVWASEIEADQKWAPTGRILVEIQRLDPATGEGLSEATFKEVAGEEGAVIAWYGWRLDPRSPRRPQPPDTEPDDVIEPGETCLMCGSPEVIYHDASGSPRCSSHVGESPEESDEDEGTVPRSELGHDFDAFTEEFTEVTETGFSAAEVDPDKLFP